MILTALLILGACADKEVYESEEFDVDPSTFSCLGSI